TARIKPVRSSGRPPEGAGMRRALLGALGCSLGWAGFAPAADEAPWRAAPPPAQSRPAAAEWTAPARPAAVLERPCPLAPAEAPTAPATPAARLVPPAPAEPMRSIAYA